MMSMAITMTMITMSMSIISIGIGIGISLSLMVVSWVMVIIANDLDRSMYSTFNPKWIIRFCLSYDHGGQRNKHQSKYHTGCA